MSPAVITLLVLLVMVVFFVTEKLPAALVAMLGGSVLVLCGIIDPAELFSAFSGSTIVLVAAMMVVGSALFHTGHRRQDGGCSGQIHRYIGKRHHDRLYAGGYNYLRGVQRRSRSRYAASHRHQRQPAGRCLRLPAADSHVLRRKLWLQPDTDGRGPAM